MTINFPINSLLANMHKSYSHAMHFSIRRISLIGHSKNSLRCQWPTKSRSFQTEPAPPMADQRLCLAPDPRHG